jgi:formylglycine-generating enzyme required for sulfatase activity
MKANKSMVMRGIFTALAIWGLVFTACGDGGGDPVPVTGVELNKTSASLIVGETLTATVAPANATNKAVTWSSSDTTVVTVSSSGAVTPVKSGSATITVTTVDGGKTAQCAVTVISVVQEIQNNMVFIAAGNFTMGSPTTEPNRSNDELPHQVTLTKSFYTGKYQVTQEQYQAVMGSNPSSFTTAVDGESGTPGKLPVEMVSWYDALVFCNKLSMMEGLDPVYSISGSTAPDDWGAVPTSSDDTWNTVTMVPGANGYRLPTEAEWEYACRAGTTTAWYTDNTEAGTPHLNTAAWYSNNAGSKTHQVGLKISNAWGLYDMHGNVCEWCWDRYGTYASGNQTDPLGEVPGTYYYPYRMERGGDWHSNVQYLRSAYRGNFHPYSRLIYIGFRLVRS